ncbi:MAG: hypothetical protein M1830_009323 [Pleopsidium flavum]|nr:MAG: hypothetical protein M1830_009323 [Pleopsidium flavum]
MEHVPGEILDTIVHHLDNHDIKSFRLCCRRFGKSGPLELFREVGIYQQRKSFHNLKMIAQHPVYRCHVRKVIYFSPFLKPELASRGPYRKAVRDSEHGRAALGLPTGSFSSQQLNVGLLHYKQFYEDQEDLRRHDQATATLAAALTRFPNLQVVQLSDVDPGEPEQHQDYASSMWSIAVKTHLPPYVFVKEHQCPPQQFLTLTRAVSVAGVHPRDLRLILADNESFYDSYGFLTADFADFDQAFGSIRKLTIACMGGRWSRGKSVHDSSLSRFVRSTSRLETFEIEVMDEILFWQRFRKIFVDVHCKWPRLRTLSLVGAFVFSADLIGFFDRHPSLVNVNLARVKICDGTWKSVLSGLRGGLLEHLAVENLTDEAHTNICGGHVDDRKLEEYVLHGKPWPSFPKLKHPDRWTGYGVAESEETEFSDKYEYYAG